MTFNIYDYTVLDLDTFETMSYAQSMKFTGRCVFLKAIVNQFQLNWNGLEPVVYLPISVMGKPLCCYRTYV